MKEDLNEMIGFEGRMVDDEVEKPRESSPTLFEEGSVG